MAKIAYSGDRIPSLVEERLRVWGLCIATQRRIQMLTAEELCQRLNISHPTLIRMQKGEPSVAVGLYLSALHVLGLLDAVAPMPEIAIWRPESKVRRVRQSSAGKSEAEDEGYY